MMAAPIVAGEAALIRATFPTLSNRKIIDHIERHTDRIQGPDPNERINVGAALTHAPEAEATNTVQMSSSGIAISEGPTSVLITVTRAGVVSTAAAINYATGDFAGTTNCNVLAGAASSRCDYEAVFGTLQFAPGETARTILVPIVDDAYAEGNESFTVKLSNASGTNLGSRATTVVINDNETVNGSNPIDQPALSCAAVIDFFNREPDLSGFAF